MTDELRERLAVAEQTLAAIYEGAADALVVPTANGPQVYTLDGADAFYRVLVEQMPEGAAALRPDGLVLFANTAFAAMAGRDLQDLLGRDLSELVDSADQGVLQDLLSGRATTGDLRLGASTFVAASTRPVLAGGAAAISIVAVDQTERRRTVEQLRAAEERFRGAFDGAPIGMALVNDYGQVLRSNLALSSILGVAPRDLLGRSLPWLDESADLHAQLKELVGRGAVELALTSEGSGAEWVAVQVSAIREEDGSFQQVIVQVQDVSQRRQVEDRLRWVADHDGLTGLLNRRGFELALERQLAVSRRHGVEGGLVLLDIDHFKYINDARGHQVGDTVLVAVAEALAARVRESDTFARLGGDEFALLVTHGDLEGTQALAEKLVTEAAQLQLPELVGLRQLTVSIGVTPLSPDRTTGELMAQADLAMYDAKEAGRNQVCVYEAGGAGSGTERRLTWLTRIRAALDADTLQLHAQPIVELATGNAVQHELLVRLPGLDGEPVVAATWFEVAERYDLATAIDRWVFTQAVALLRERPASWGGLNINLSATSIGRAGLLEHLRAGVTEGGFDPGRLTIEITETAALTNMGAAARFVEEIHGLGFRLALDDFGAGYGSFYYLKHLPFDDVKIDGEFVRNSVNDSRDQSIIRAMVDVARAMGRRTVAESIEDEATLELMRDHGVDLVQGYHVGRPQALA